MCLWTLSRVVNIQGDSVDRTASLRPEIALAESSHQHHRDDRVSCRCPAVDVLLCRGEAIYTLCCPRLRSLKSHVLYDVEVGS